MSSKSCIDAVRSAVSLRPLRERLSVAKIDKVPSASFNERSWSRETPSGKSRGTKVKLKIAGFVPQSGKTVNVGKLLFISGSPRRYDVAINLYESFTLEYVQSSTKMVTLVYILSSG